MRLRHEIDQMFNYINSLTDTDLGMHGEVIRSTLEWVLDDLSSDDCVLDYIPDIEHQPPWSMRHDVPQRAPLKSVPVADGQSHLDD